MVCGVCVCSVVCGVWCVVVWCVVCGVWCVECGVWSGVWSVEWSGVEWSGVGGGGGGGGREARRAFGPSNHYRITESPYQHEEY